jgi:predicted DNA repair protein MutK
MGSTIYLVPPLALLFGWAFPAEVPPLLVLPGGALCLAGVALARTGGRNRRPDRRRDRRPAEQTSKKLPLARRQTRRHPENPHALSALTTD